MALLQRGALAAQRVARSRATLRAASSWSAVVDSAKSALSADGSATDGRAAVQSLLRDPLEVVGEELSSLRHNIASLLGSGHPSLDRVGKYYFQAEGLSLIHI